MITEKEFEAKQEASRKEGFRRWLTEPMTKALISTIPQCDNLEILLQAAFDRGHGTGCVSTAVSFLEHAMTRP